MGYWLLSLQYGIFKQVTQLITSLRGSVLIKQYFVGNSIGRMLFAV